jgi:hypothetical protein
MTMGKVEKTAVYLGSGLCIPGHKNGPALKEFTRYICIDTPKTNFWSATGQSVYDRLPGSVKKRVQLLRVSAKDTGIKEGSIDEVHLHNILGDRNILEGEKIFFEALRITRGGGLIYVGEILSPYPLDLLLEMGRKSGLDVETMINGGVSYIGVEEKETFYRIIGEYYRVSDQDKHETIHHDSYLVTFKKRR